MKMGTFTAHGVFGVYAEDTIIQAIFRCHIRSLTAPLDANLADGYRPFIERYRSFTLACSLWNEARALMPAT